jgi:hypothetical protein
MCQPTDTSSSLCPFQQVSSDDHSSIPVQPDYATARGSKTCGRAGRGGMNCDMPICVRGNRHWILTSHQLAAAKTTFLLHSPSDLVIRDSSRITIDQLTF